MRCVIEMGVYLSRTGSTLNVIWVLGGLGLILKIEGGGGARHALRQPACIYPGQVIVRVPSVTSTPRTRRRPLVLLIRVLVIVRPRRPLRLHHGIKPMKT